MINPHYFYLSFLAYKKWFENENQKTVKYNMKITPEKFESKPEKGIFYSLAKKYPRKPVMIKVIVSSILENNYPTNLEETDKIYQAFEKTYDSMERTYTQELKKLNLEFTSLIMDQDDTHPKLLKAILGKKISWFTFAIFLDLFPNVVSLYDESLANDFIWKEYKLKAKKLMSLYPNNHKEKYKLETKEIFKNISSDRMDG